MNNIILTTASVADVLQALEDIGFTVSTSQGIARWENDTNNKIYFKFAVSSSYTTINIYNSSNTKVWGEVSLTTSTSYKMTYEVIGESVVFGFNAVSNTGNMIHFGVIAPTSENDDWEYLAYYVGNSATATNRFINGRTEVITIYSTTSMYNGSALGVQIVKAYDTTRFLDNIYLTSVCESIQAGHIITSSANNFAEATIGNDTYLIINMTNNANYNKIAIKKSTTS